jgi:hypothetical protein
VNAQTPQPANAEAPTVEPTPGPDRWDETPAEAARFDDRYWVDRDYGDEPDDPSDHYYY